MPRNALSTLADDLAFLGLPGYTFKGIYQEIQKHLGSSVQNYIVAARTAQGYDEWHHSTPQERLDVVSRWQGIQVEVEKEKHSVRHGSFQGPHCYLKATIEERKRQSAEKKKHRKNERETGADRATVAIPTAHPFVRQKSERSSHDSADFEAAIKTAVTATSRGNLEEDMMIERAIRASVQELRLASEEGDDAAAIQRAIQASVAEAARYRGQDIPRVSSEGLDGAHDHDKDLESALHRSVLAHPTSNTETNIDFDDSGVDTDDDENIKTAIERSMSAETSDARAGNQIDEDLHKAIKLSQKDHQEREQGLSKSKTEEEIVLDYVKKQSLAEEMHKRSVLSKSVTK